MVWSGQVGGKPKHVPEAAALMPDPRALHYWDEERMIGRAYREFDLDGETLTIGNEAWDVWLLFDRDARWGDDGPPKASWWEHQLNGMPQERRLDPERFAAKAAQLRRPER